MLKNFSNFAIKTNPVKLILYFLDRNAMAINDIHEFIDKLEKAGELKRVKTEVDTNLEIAEILRRVSYTNGPAILFENVKDYEMPILGNAFGSIKRLEIGLETNGTITPPRGIDWICVSPKANTTLNLKKGNELKIVYPQCGLNPKIYEKLEFEHFFIQPMDGEESDLTIKKSRDFILKHPQWKLSLQTHKIMGIP